MMNADGVTIADAVRWAVEAHGRQEKDVVDIYCNHPTDPTKVLIVFDDSDLRSCLVVDLARPLQA